jgi:hypothetical protein
MPEKQYYSTTVSQEASFAVLVDTRDNEQSVQAFTQLPSTVQVGANGDDALSAHDIFSLFTAQVMMEKRVFTR